MGRVSHRSLHVLDETTYTWKTDFPTRKSEEMVLRAAGYSEGQISRVFSAVRVDLAHAAAVFTDYVKERNIPILELYAILKYRPSRMDDARLLRAKNMKLEALGLEGHWITLSDLNDVLSSTVKLYWHWQKRQR